ncbi:formate dehydrogenase accessory sulfurtransferase FdhD [Metabacillus sp. GX 13764]|uniref:formate dehydrogenase accessory sulfurtransferase FdhD n=1 Tax=Metabacillus kandeliae TaxID=2900151 RepID=UPI001E33CA02|nr:formate dehydrogenase accessory sulfurtransferase FdhD [Metabacillus kandeliae]MCD7035621.1 formate dehydrogenase accessory sulfurtransferase FdhD [Metabacillus kandeliae]
MDSDGIRSLPVLRYASGVFSEETDEVAAEFPLTIVLNGEEWATMVCTPSDLTELVVGFLASEGVIRRYEEISSLSIDESKGFAYVESAHVPEQRRQNVSKRFIGSCCGKSRQFYFQNDMLTAKTITSSGRISPEQALQIMSELHDHSEQFQRTGGMHNAAISGNEGVVRFYHDIGRHNALDKLYGYCLIHRIPVRDKVIAFSGRISSEVLLKVSKMGIGILLSKSAPTDLALQLADDLGITAIGFIRKDRMNVYTHPERIFDPILHS